MTNNLNTVHDKFIAQLICRNNAEDEDPDICYETYLETGVVNEHATLKCASMIYPSMETISTPCDGVTECQNNLDEEGCGRQNFASKVSFVLILVLFLSLRIKNLFVANVKTQNNRKINFEIELDEKD